MKAFQEFAKSEPHDLIELSKQGYFTILLDENLRGIEGVRFIDDKPDRTNETVKKISAAVRRSQIGTRKGNFWLNVRDDGSFHLEQLH